MKLSRVFAAAPAEGFCAGSMDSRNGSAKVTPLPRRNVLRERCFFVMKFMMRSPLTGSGSLGAVLHSHLKRFALHHTEDHGGKAVIIASRRADNISYSGHVVCCGRTSHGISQKL